jgi:ATP-dependent helicase HrpA
LAEFYARHITNVSSLHELNRMLRESGAQEKLCITEEELAGGQQLNYDATAFPDSVQVGGQPVPLAYAYAPGEEHDGVTIKLPFSVAQMASPGLVEWAVPGLREEMINELLRALPKAVRRELMPLPPKATEIAREFQPAGMSFLQDLGAFLHRRYGVEVKAADWPANALPAHLRPRIEIVDHDKRSLGASRDLAGLQQRLKQTKIEPAPKVESTDWLRVTQQWERFGVREWTFGDLPERITVIEGPGLPLYAWPGIEFAEAVVNVRLFRNPDQARTASLTGVQRLVELAIQKDLAWLEKDLRALSRFDALYAPLGGSDELRETALEHLKRHLLPAEPLPALTRAAFDAALAEARQRLPGLSSQFFDRLGPLLQLRQQVQQRIGVAATPIVSRNRSLTSLSQLGSPSVARPSHPLASELANLMPSRFLDHIEFDRLPNLARYLKALLIRSERAALNPTKDQERVRQITPYQEALKRLQTQPSRSQAAQREIETFRWMIEEFKVSLFAQELGTAMPVSAKRLDQQLQIVQQTH